MSADTLPESKLTPFQNVALTFSGGGFRAAAFSTGALSYMNSLKNICAQKDSDKNLLGNVSFISSTSGGSFTNALYSSYIHRGKKFEAVYKKIKEDLAGEKLLDRVVEIINDGGQWNRGDDFKSRNFINAFAKAYDEIIFEGETFGAFWRKENVKRFEVCFNSTEFFRGLSFRFQTEGTDSGYQIIGNKYLHFDTKQLSPVKKIKLADMVAASSCFPAGFEPIIFPRDFTYANNAGELTNAELQHSMVFENYAEEKHALNFSCGFMDGGITDNQGLFSVMIADRKRRKRKEQDPFDVIVVTDVTSYFMDEYKVQEIDATPAIRSENLAGYFAKIKMIVKQFLSAITIGTIISFLLFICGAALIYFQKAKPPVIIGGVLFGISAMVWALLIFASRTRGINWLKKNRHAIANETILTEYVKKANLFSEKAMLNLLRFLRVTKLGSIEQMIKARITSMLSLVLDVNLKQTRRLIYEMFYNDEMWDNRRIPNFIYELSDHNKISRRNRFNNPERLKWDATEADKLLFLEGCEQMNTIAESATVTGTTLWFNDADQKDEKLKKIIAAGQFTTCANFLEYCISLLRKKVMFSENSDFTLAELIARLTEDFNHFKKDPYWLYN